MTLRVSQTTPATSWQLITTGEMPYTFENNKLPKAIFLNASGNVQLLGKDGVSVTFTPVEGVPIQLRPTVIQSASVDVIVLYD